jgi:hypothetical protein
MKALLSALIILALSYGQVAHAQMASMASPTPTISGTSPLGTGAGTPISPPGISLGATELPSAGVSPLAAPATGTIANPGNGAVCSTVGAAVSEMFGSSASFDGGGMATGSSAPATGAMAGDTAASLGTSAAIAPTSDASTPSGAIDTSGMSSMCGSGSTNVIASSAPSSTTSTVGGAVSRTGIPLGSSEIPTAGIGSGAAVPTPTVSPFQSSSLGTAVTPAVPVVTVPSENIPMSATGAN